MRCWRSAAWRSWWRTRPHTRSCRRPGIASWQRPRWNDLPPVEEAASAIVERRRLFASERQIEISRARQPQTAAGSDRTAELETVLEQMATNALGEEAAMRSNQIDELVGFLADREDLRRNDPPAGEQNDEDVPGSAGEEESGTVNARRHLVLLSDGLGHRSAELLPGTRTDRRLACGRGGHNAEPAARGAHRGRLRLDRGAGCLRTRRPGTTVSTSARTR